MSGIDFQAVVEPPKVYATMLITFNTFFFTLLLFCAFIAFGQWRLSRDIAVPWYIGYLIATFLHYGRQFWIDISDMLGVSDIPDPPLEWDTPLSYTAFACYLFFVRQIMQIWVVAPRLSNVMLNTARFLGLMSGGHLVIQAFLGNATADVIHQVVQVILFPMLTWLVIHTLLNARLFYQKLILIGTAALMLGFLSAIAQRRWTDDYALLPDMLRCFPTRWGDICMYHLKVGVTLDVLCFSWAITLRQKMLLQEAVPTKPLLLDLPVEDDPFLQQLSDFLEQHYNEETLNVEQIAESVYLTAGQVNRKMKEKTGLTTEQYLLRYRLEKALKKILCTHDSISQIMMDVGFKDMAHFSRSFKKQFGQSPSAMRRK